MFHFVVVVDFSFFSVNYILLSISKHLFQEIALFILSLQDIPYSVFEYGVSFSTSFYHHQTCNLSLVCPSSIHK